MSTRLKDTFRPGQPVASIPADWLNTVARWLNTINVNGGPRFTTPYELKLYLANGESGGTADAQPFSFRAYATSATAIHMDAGDITIGPCSFIDWDDIDGATTTPDVDDSGAEHTRVWLEVKVDSNPETTGSLGAGYAWLKLGSESDMRGALDSTEILTTCVVPLVAVTWSGGAITEVRNLHCGDVLIARAAG
jgi:hypothetical protein